MIMLIKDIRKPEGNPFAAVRSTVGILLLILCIPLASCKCTDEMNTFNEKTAGMAVEGSTVAAPIPTQTKTFATVSASSKTAVYMTPDHPTDEPGLETDAHEHVFAEWQTVCAATCQRTGLERRVCTLCKETEERQTEKTDHIPEAMPSAASTCEKNGQTGGEVCAVCGEIIVSPTILSATGHTPVWEALLQPTYRQKGITGKITCSTCGKTVGDHEKIPAVGAEEMISDGVLKILLIGNSFSQDTVCWEFEGKDNMLLQILEAMLGEKAEVQIGICQSGSKTMAWHASMAESGRKEYSFHILSSNNPVWKQPIRGEVSNATALSYTDWDIVSLQPFGAECTTGIAAPTVSEEENSRFYPLKTSLSYMLDAVEAGAPQADVFLIMPWSESVEIERNAGLYEYRLMQKIIPSLLSCTGEKTEKPAMAIIPTGLAVQNARTTDLSLLNVNTDKGHYQDRQYDVQFGLVRDGLHLSFNVGRYIAALCFAETVVPQELRIDGGVLPGIRKSEALGELPEEYTSLTQNAVSCAIEGAKNGAFEIVEI